MNSNECVAVLFDFDGVMVDTEGQYSLFWNEMGRKYLPEIPQFGTLIKGQTLTQILDKYLSGREDDQREIVRQLDLYEQQMTYDFIPGVEDFLKDLRAHGVKTAIVTSSNEAKMRNVYRAHPDLKQQVDRILTAEMFSHSKPDPDCFLLGARTFGLEPKQCVVFEDSFHGLEAGRRAGMTVIGLATTNPADQIADKASAILKDFCGFTYEKMCAIMKQGHF